MEELLRENPTALGLVPGDIVVRYDCSGSSASQAVVSRLSREYGVDISIIFGNVEMLLGTPFGTMIVVFRGEEKAVREALEAFSQIGKPGGGDSPCMNFCRKSCPMWSRRSRR